MVNLGALGRHRAGWFSVVSDVASNRYEAPGWRVDVISLSLVDHGRRVSMGGSTNLPRNGQQFRVVRPGMVDYVPTLEQLQQLMGPDFAQLAEVV